MFHVSLSLFSSKNYFTGLIDWALARYAAGFNFSQNYMGEGHRKKIMK